MDFSLTTMFVVPSGTLASSGSTDALLPDQLGIYRDDFSIATAGNIAAAKWFQIAQGRPYTAQKGLASKRSDKIHASKVVDWYKTVAEDTATNQISTLGNFQNLKCGQQLYISFRAHSFNIDLVHFNGMTRSILVNTPCCDCGEVPCEDIDAAAIEAIVDEAIIKLNDEDYLSPYLSFSKTGSGASAAIRVESKPVVRLNNAYELRAQATIYDRVWFRGFATIGPPTLQDTVGVEDFCEGANYTFTTQQRSSYPHGSSQEIAELERYYYSYQVPAFKSLHNNPAWNDAFDSQVVAGTWYDLYYLKCREHDQQTTWAQYTPLDFTVILAFPTGQGSAFETVLTAALGAPQNKSGANISTTTTTSTSTTTTTTTTQLQP